MNDDARRYLIRVAADAVRAVVHERPSPILPPFSWSDSAPRGAFVTLRRRGQLRGCIGTFSPEHPLPRTVSEMAAQAVHDPRFTDQPLGPDDLPDVQIEISVLSALQRSRDPESLEVGVHGIYVRGRGRSGCFLPQVAGEAGWDARTFLSRCCEMKAGMPPDAWRDPETEVYLFTTEKICGGMTAEH